MKTKLLSIFALLLMAATGAWAQTPTLLTTIESKENLSFTSGSKTFDNIATVTFSGEGEVVNPGKRGWSTPLALDNRSILLTVTAVEGYTITSCKFYYETLYVKFGEDFEAPFQATLSHDGTKHLIEVNGNSFIGSGVTKIEVYGYPTPSVTLVDGEAPSELSSYKGKTVDVTYTRPFTAGKASTVCLPFEYVKKSGEKFYAFTSVSKDGDDYVAEMTEDEAATLTANTPYLFMPSTTGDVDFSGTYTIPAAIEAGETVSGDWMFTGTYETKEWEETPTGIYGFSAQDTEDGISQGQFVKVGKYVRIKPMRAYLMYKGGSENYAAVRMKAPTRGANEEMLPETISVRLIDADGEVSAIGTLNTVTGKVSLDGWYTLSGKRLMGQPTQKGIYVNNGKKVIIK